MSTILDTILVILALALWCTAGICLMFPADHRTGFQMSRDLIRRRRYLSPTGVIFWLCMLWPAGLVWYWRRWR